MSLLVYAITDGPLESRGSTVGVAERPVHAIGTDGLRALVSEHDRAPAVTEAAVWAFDEVIEHEMATRAVLPARFGSMVADRRSVQALLDSRRAQLSVRLEHVRGAVELGVRAAWTPGEDPPALDGPASGVAYMHERVAARARARGLATRLDAALRPLARAARHRLLSHDGTRVSAAYLVDRDRVPEFAGRAAELDDELEADVICTGPWPPYSFAQEGADG
jgi:hypothetical protein